MSRSFLIFLLALGLGCGSAGPRRGGSGGGDDDDSADDSADDDDAGDDDAGDDDAGDDDAGDDDSGDDDAGDDDAGDDDAGDDDAGDDDAAPCSYPTGAVEPMTVGEVLTDYAWSDARLYGGSSVPLDLEAAHCNTDPNMDWSPFDVLLFVSIPAW
jgi:hypothetical protein